jgi:hypothetical protein
MQRVRADFLVPGEDGKLRHGEAPFSGLAYQIGEDGVLSGIVAVEEGVITGPSTDWLALPEGGLRVDWASLEMREDYGPRLFRDRPFTGIAYYFTERGFCGAEMELKDGYPTEVSEREWYETGQPKVLIGGGEYMSWFPDGRLERRGMGGVQVYGLNIQDDGRLRGLVLEDATFLNLEILRRLTPTEDFMMLGAAIDADLLRFLRDQTEIGAVQKLRLVKTGIDAGGVGVLASFKNLVEIWLDRNPGLGPQEARQIEQRRPGCVVHVEIEPTP